VAALTVVISHLHGLGFANLQAVHDFFDGGRPAVSFFFILSGFILSYNYKDLSNSPKIKNFWVARFARIYPIHLLGLAIALTGFAIFTWKGEYLEVLRLYSVKPEYHFRGMSINSTPLLFISFLAQLLLLTAWLPVASLNQPWNGPAWSISCEAFFYAMFPWLNRKVPKRASRGLLLITILFALQILLILGLKHLSPKTNFLVSQFPLTHLPDFIAGVIAGNIHNRGQLQAIRSRSTEIFFAALAMIGILSAWRPIAPMYVVLEPAFVALIFSVANMRSSATTKLMSAGIFKTLGESSYSLYIVHVPCLVLLSALGLYLPWQGLLLGLIGLSVALHGFIEEPARKWLRGKFARPV
jgi:peptidoglycan/LPS O-acetylase OafA/YrhL